MDENILDILIVEGNKDFDMCSNDMSNRKYYIPNKNVLYITRNDDITVIELMGRDEAIFVKENEEDHLQRLNFLAGFEGEEEEGEEEEDVDPVTGLTS